MSKRQRPPNAARRASFGRAERLRREAGDTRQPKRDTSRKQPAAACPERAPKQEARPGPDRVHSHDRKLTPLHRAEDRLERSRAASERRQQTRLKEQTRAAFNREGERRRETERRTEHDRKRDALQHKTRRIEEHQRRANIRRLERKRGEMKQAFARAADRRRDAARRVEHVRQQDLQRRAAAQIEREQKRRAEDQKAEHRRQQDQLRARHKGERNSFRVNETTAMERHHHAIKGIDRREADRLHDFDGRRNGLAGRVAELVPGRRAENDRQRAEIVRGYESERLAKHRELEAFKERAFAREQKTRLDQARELKELRGMHRDERGALGRDQAELRPRQVEDRARSMERAEQAREQERGQERGQDRDQAERPREEARPTGDFARAASDHAPEPTAAPRELTREPAQDMSPPAREIARA